jgi:uncharacterized small protein (DUF1192 family)
MPESKHSKHGKSVSTGVDALDDGEEDAKANLATEAEIRARILNEIEMQKEIERLEAEESAKEAEKARNEALSKSDLTNIYTSSEFQTFLDSSSKILERALNDKYDYLRDYTIGDGDAGLSVPINLKHRRKSMADLSPISTETIERSASSKYALSTIRDGARPALSRA